MSCFFFCHVRICGGKNIKKSSLVGLIHDVNIPPYHMGSENKLKRLGGKILHSSLHHSYNNYNNSILLRKFLIKLVLLYFFNLALWCRCTHCWWQWYDNAANDLKDILHQHLTKHQLQHYNAKIAFNFSSTQVFFEKSVSFLFHSSKVCGSHGPKTVDWPDWGSTAGWVSSLKCISNSTHAFIWIWKKKWNLNCL